MIDLDLKQAADKAIALQPQKRVLPFLYQDQALSLIHI